MEITIREVGQDNDEFQVIVEANRNTYGPFDVRNPLTEKAEAELAWYFEEWLQFPFIGKVRAEQAAALIPVYGEALFDQIIKKDTDFYGEYKAIFNYEGGYGDLSFAIAGSPAFHALHWEALKDPEQPRPFSLECPFVRQNLDPSHIRARVKRSPTLNILLVTARPGGRRDVGYRTISRPLVEALRQSSVRANIELVRPGTYEALVNHLEQRRDKDGPGYYQVIHFDLHGSLMSHEGYQYLIEKGAEALQASPHSYQAGYGRTDLSPYPGQKAFLFFTGAGGTLDPVVDQQLADLLQTHQIPVAILNACQSAKQVSDVPGVNDVPETSLGSRLMDAGVQLVLAMGYSVTVTAAKQMMATLYGELFAEKPLAQSLRQARLALYNRKGRKGTYDQTRDLEDWLLPVVYQNRPMELRVSNFDDPAVEAAYYQRQGRRYEAPATTFGFVGRDVDILDIERRMLAKEGRNILLIRGMGGAGKSTLLRHLMEWWQTTGLVERVCYFGYDEKAHTLEQIIFGLGRVVYGERGYISQLQALPLEAQAVKLSEKLRSERHLLVLDNLESITGAALSVKHTLDESEQAKLGRFLTRLVGGKTLVLLGSRGGEGWLMAGDRPALTEADIYDLPGLDEGAAADLAERILGRQGVTHYRSDKKHREDFQRLLRLLDGYPLAMEVVLANLARQTPGETLAALAEGEAAVDVEASGDLFQDKTRSILRCIEYSHSNLSPESQGLLACLAPFSGVVNTDWLAQYSQQLGQQDELKALPFDRWTEVIEEAVNWGLLTPHEIGGGYYRLQPILPYFLRSRLQEPTLAAARRAVETAFHQHYEGIGGTLSQLIQSKEAQERQLGQVLINLEFDNLLMSLKLALVSRSKFWGMFISLEPYLDARQEHQQSLEIKEIILRYQDSYSAEAMAGETGFHFGSVFDAHAQGLLLLKQYQKAEESYKQGLIIADGLIEYDRRFRGSLKAKTYHQLGIVAQAQRQWQTAEQHYQQALAIYIEFNDRYSQAATYHQLGIVAQEQRQWQTAEQHYQQALVLYIEFNDRYSQAATYHQLGIVAQKQRQWQTAEQHYQQALAIYIEFNDRYSQAATYHQLGIVAQEQRQWQTAEQHYQQALAIFIEFNHRYSQAATYHQLGIVAQEQRQWQTAEQHYQQALAICIEINDRYEQAKTYHQLGSVAQEQRQWQTAEQHYQQALAIKIEFNDRYKQASTYHQLGMVAEEQENWEQAVDYFLQTLQIDKEFSEDYHIQNDLRSLRRIWQAGEEGRVPSEVVARLVAGVGAALGMAEEAVVGLFREICEIGNDGG